MSKLNPISGCFKASEKNSGLSAFIAVFSIFHMVMFVMFNIVAFVRWSVTFEELRLLAVFLLLSYAANLCYWKEL